jgi:hypothetical protein
VELAYTQELLRYKLEPNTDAAARAAHDAADLGQLKTQILHDRDQAVAAADSARKTALAAAGKLTGAAADDARRNADAVYRGTMRQAFAIASSQYRMDSRIKNEGLFDIFYAYESNQLSSVIRGVREWNWFGEEQPVAGAVDLQQQDLQAFVPMATAANPLDTNPLDTHPAAVQPPAVDLTDVQTAVAAELLPLQGTPGVVQSALRFFTVGPIWLLTQHSVYFAIFGVLFLVLWSVFGGAISRIAAVHVARDEKLSIRSALVFSGGKFLSFLFAPIIPLLIVTVVGLLVGAGSLLGSIPLFGPIIVGLFFVVALGAGFIMALVLLGLVGGFNLMYPTVAVEGSDSFDAISRSFSYLYARPWRLAFYTLVSLIYGAATYLFVRLFIYLMLVLTHKAVGVGVFTSAGSTAPLWTSLWPSPATAGRLSYDIDTLSLNFPQEIGARLIWFWVHGVIAILGAFAVSFYFSANTIIYYLMRQEVDATDLDDVYLEQADDEFADPAAAPAPPIAGSTDAIVTAAGEVAPPPT